MKQVADIMEGAYPAPRRRPGKVADTGSTYADMSPAAVMRRAGKLEKKMLRHARDLEFEEAAKLRDEIRRLREYGLGLVDSAAG